MLKVPHNVWDEMWSAYSSKVLDVPGFNSGVIVAPSMISLHKADLKMYLDALTE